ncbi:MAG: efflux RND transporter periplasmic adaptor subunit [Gammaproteobacteria bacterium]
MLRSESTRPAAARAALLLALLLGIAGCRGGDGRPGKGDAADEEGTPAVPVEVAPVRHGDVYAVYSGTASLETDADAVVVAKVGGEVREIMVEEGDQVEANQILARLDGDRLRLEMERARANLRKLKQEYDRNVELHERGLVSAGAFEDIKYELEALRAAYELAQLEYGYTQIRAPIEGVIADRFIKLGNTISANDPVFHVTDMDPLLAYVYVPEREFRRLTPGQPAELVVDAIPGQTFAARIQRISPVVDPDTGTFKVTMEVPDPDSRLKPGMFGRFNIVWDAREDTLLVPRVAVIDDETEQAVFVLDGDTVRRAEVTLGYPKGEMIEVIEGLSGDEQVVVIGQAGLKDGARVEVVRREPAPDADLPAAAGTGA